MAIDHLEPMFEGVLIPADPAEEIRVLKQTIELQRKELVRLRQVNDTLRESINMLHGRPFSEHIYSALIERLRIAEGMPKEGGLLLPDTGYRSFLILKSL